MKLRMTSVVIFSALALSAIACSSADTTGTGNDDLNGHPVCDPLKCSANEHWSSKKCKCVADCTEMWACTPDEHWDADACQCVANVVCDPLVCKSGEHWSSTLCACVADCTEMWMCVQGDHWDGDACKCVPDVTPASN
jgi:hypothetical protein